MLQKHDCVVCTGVAWLGFYGRMYWQLRALEHISKHIIISSTYITA